MPTPFFYSLSSDKNSNQKNALVKMLQAFTTTAKTFRKLFAVA
jgi:hypothetical protein